MTATETEKNRDWTQATGVGRTVGIVFTNVDPTQIDRVTGAAREIGAHIAWVEFCPFGKRLIIEVADKERGR